MEITLRVLKFLWHLPFRRVRGQPIRVWVFWICVVLVAPIVLPVYFGFEGHVTQPVAAFGLVVSLIAVACWVLGIFDLEWWAIDSAGKARDKGR